MRPHVDSPYAFGYGRVMPELRTFPANAFPADNDLTFPVESEQEGDLYEIWEVRSDSPVARRRTIHGGLPERIARATAAEWTDESVENYLMERRGPVKPKVFKKYVVVKAETQRSLVVE